ncbi:thiamine pyrophosphate-requiring protein [Komagataeibacter xylinus]|uniref:Thiamine pyrophosphate-requiring protein n=1 Tax=Komagataeibacter swingsii TaxID=215220 RepID=A0A2V4RIX2_9PROT|nr:thiamine pyrophosphate-requiring protein [Komagataeibacter swingsii]AHI27407.1 acetolactate synthase large subunit [Komagataeibacter xylinus E25]RFP01497.1 thiamine pyrophosphate-requiring protein [Komagataeibacter xylinus]PYD68625.1 thiamine pyrophosphate-requiring protein [Komagataeibacter swingsii]RFP01870.1 thiamine pyrophosphate-requiring protein [Komagataeibacter xylinus]GBQ55985.1 thiamine pyrophosphate protein [Komagataeibacter swingsii DSM 16373]
MNVSEFLWKRLQEWGLRRAYGYPGDGAGGIDVALQREVDAGNVEYVQVRHEEMAAFMATAHAKFTGQVGLCFATSGPGAIHLLNGLYDAKLDHVGVVAIMGQQARTAIGTNYQQEVDLQSLCKDVACEYIVTVTEPSQMRHALDRAVRIARDKRAPTVVIVPNDLQELPYADPPMAHGATHTGIGTTVGSKVPEEAGLRAAAEILNAGKKVAILAGAGALEATDQLLQIAEILGAGIAKALLGKAAVPDELPFVTGSIGLLGTKPSWDLMKECDTFLMVGSSFPYSEFLPKPGHARGVQIDINGANLSLRYPMEVNLQGDSAATLRALIPLLHHNSDRSWRAHIEKEVAQWWKVLEARAMTSARPLNPQRVFWELSPRLPENAIITADSGSVANWYARDLKIRRGMKASLSGGLASLGAGTPYAMAGKMAYPERTVIACMGDGAMQMNGLNVMITISKYWKQWSNPRLIVLVLNNQDLNQVTWEERIQLGKGKTESTQSIPDFPYHRYAELLGLKGIYVDDPDDVATAWEEALSADRPVILEARTDPNVPPLPPHITLQQAKAFLSSLPTEPERASVILGSAKEMLASFLPAGKS